MILGRQSGRDGSEETFAEKVSSSVSGFFSFLGRTIGQLTTRQEKTFTALEASQKLRHQVLLNNRRLGLTYKIDFKLVTAAFPAPAPGNPGGGPGKPGGPSKEDLLALFSLLVSLNCLVATGPLLVAYEATAFAINGYELSKKTVDMVKRIKDSDDSVTEFNSQNVSEWLEIVSSASGFASTAISKKIVRDLRNGKAKDTLKFLAKILDKSEEMCETANYYVKARSEEFKKELEGMSRTERDIEMGAALIHFIKLGGFYE